MKDSKMQKQSFRRGNEMKKILTILVALFMSVMCTACLNNFNSFAVQELNNKAKDYLNKGELNKAISRLESNVDLDGGKFETRYNLAVAYIKAEEFEKALAQIQIAQGLNPENADIYYLKGNAAEGLANSLIEDDDDQEDKNEQKKLSQEDKTKIAKNLGLAVEAYNEYITKNPETEDKAAIEAKMVELLNEIIKYDPTYNQTETKDASAEK